MVQPALLAHIAIVLRYHGGGGGGISGPWWLVAPIALVPILVGVWQRRRRR